MKAWLPYGVAVVLGLGVAFFAFAPSGKKAGENAEQVAANGDPAKDGIRIGNRRDGKTSAEVVAEHEANPPPPPGTLRPLNEGEIAHQARLARPFNKHFAQVSSLWQSAGKLAGPAGSELSTACWTMSITLRDQGALDDATIDIPGTIAKEKELIATLRKSGPKSDELTRLLDYLDASAQAVLDGTDPTTIPRPSAP